VGVNVGVAGAKVGNAKAVEFGTGERTASHPREVKMISKMTQAIVTRYDGGIRSLSLSVQEFASTEITG
jgi:hypothetical protein